MELDFSKLDDISYRGFDGAEAREKKDEWIENGYTIVEWEKTPFTDVGNNDNVSCKPFQQAALKREIDPFTDVYGERSYKALYRAACDFHMRHTPPRLDQDNGAAYWAAAVEDMGEVAARFGNDPFLTGLLAAVYEELERDFMRLTEKQREGCP